MKKDYLICIDGKMEQDDFFDHIQLKTRGAFLYKEGNFFITYQESETTGYAGCTTIVKVAQDSSRVAMLRYGPAASQLIIEKGIRHVCHYETGTGALNLGVAADEICCNLTPTGGTVEFSYTLDSGVQEISRNLVTITVS